MSIKSSSRGIDLCHISTTFNRKSGSARRTLAIAEYMADKGWSVLLVFGADHDMEGYDGPVPWVEISKLRKPIHPLNDFLSGVRLYRTLSKLKPKIVHTHLAKAGIIGRFVSILMSRDVTVMHTVHGPTFDSSMPIFNQKIYSFLERKMATATDVLVYVGRGLQDVYSNAHVKGAKREEIIYTGKNVKYFKPKHYASPGNIEKSFSLLYVGRIVPVKQHSHALRLVDRLLKEGLQIKLDIVGSALTPAEITHEVELKALVSDLSLNDYVTFVGHSNNVSDHYRRADLCLLTSAYEGLPNVVVESLTNGTPIVSYDVCGIQELLSKTMPELIVRKNDEEMLFEVVQEALSSLFSLEERVIATQKTLGDKFDMQKMLLAKRALYEEYV